MQSPDAFRPNFELPRSEEIDLELKNLITTQSPPEKFIQYFFQLRNKLGMGENLLRDQGIYNTSIIPKLGTTEKTVYSFRSGKNPTEGTRDNILWKITANNPDQGFNGYIYIGRTLDVQKSRHAFMNRAEPDIRFKNENISEAILRVLQNGENTAQLDTIALDEKALTHAYEARLQAVETSTLLWTTSLLKKDKGYSNSDIANFLETLMLPQAFKQFRKKSHILQQEKIFLFFPQWTERTTYTPQLSNNPTLHQANTSSLQSKVNDDITET